MILYDMALASNKCGRFGSWQPAGWTPVVKVMPFEQRVLVCKPIMVVVHYGVSQASGGNS
ncbi:hypothetical protein [Paenibacillus sp. FSL H7-0331]|uniref:hypothetical protein n=1 Tax=Paenibacillus sp. FSL H7-0331 TaxID=1920421 RepID=UPI0015C35B8D|nr:hypothetical protein [Paenibacillus sp. FSL H7-0331]